MEELSHSAKIKATGIRKFGSEAKWRAHLAESGMRGKKTGTGGFHYLAKHEPERLVEISKKGGRGRHGQKD